MEPKQKYNLKIRLEKILNNIKFRIILITHNPQFY